MSTRKLERMTRVIEIMRAVVKVVIKDVFILTACIAVGVILLLAVYSLPTKKMSENAGKSMDLLLEEGAYPRLYGEMDLRMNLSNFGDLKVFLLNTRGTARDNITDAIMLNIAVFGGEGNIVKRAMLNERATYSDSGNALEELSRYLNGEKDYTAQEYARYWHGYLVFLKPLLLKFSYQQIKWINIICMTALLAVIIFLFIKKGKKKDLFLWLYSMLFMVPIVIPFCMQYCTVSYIMLFCMLYVVCHDGDLNSKWLGSFFLIVGGATSYIDFLTFPLVGLGMPLIYLLNQSSGMGLRKKLEKIIFSIFSWAFGYVGVWASKWVLASLLTKENIVSEAIFQVIYRSSSTPDVGDFSITPFLALASNLSCFTNVFILILIAIGFFSILVYWKKMKAKVWIPQNCAAYSCICVIPFLWTMFFKNHSYGHGSYTYRIFAVTVYGGMSMLVWGRRDAKFPRKAAE